jgi:hypothetical protein
LGYNLSTAEEIWDSSVWEGISTMKYTVKNCPDSPWKKGFEKELIARCVTQHGKPILETTITIKEILG